MRKPSSNTKVFEYPFEGQRISRRDAIDFVAHVVYPYLDVPAGKKRVSDRVRIAERTQLLSRDDKSDTFDAGEFFSWAIHGRGWEALREVVDLPLKQITARGTLRPQPAVLNGIAISIPADNAELREKYSAYAAKALKQAQELAVLREREAKRKAISRKKSEAGKKAHGVSRTRAE